MSPLLIFDKSFLQSLSVNEAVILDQLFSCVITPLFFIETMADLTKETSRGRTAEQVVGSLAERTPVARSYINTHHKKVMLDDLFGRRQEEVDHRPVVSGGISVKVEGKAGVVFRKAPEREAFDRWQDGKFLEVERRFAKAWRDDLEKLDLPAITKLYQAMVRKEDRPKSHQAARDFARALVDLPGQNYRLLQFAIRLLDVPRSAAPRIIQTWKAAGSPSLRAYAPFAAHCLEVDLFFALAMSNGIISDKRSSNSIDIRYLYYLPFANIFVSGDKLHRSSVPLFIDHAQHMVWGPDLKADLAVLVSHFLMIPEEVEAKGLYALTSSPPLTHQGLVAKLWDSCMPSWRTRTPLLKTAPQEHAEVWSQYKRLIEAAKGERRGPFLASDEVNDLVVERHIPIRRGSWRMFSAEVEAEGDPGW